MKRSGLFFFMAAAVATGAGAQQPGGHGMAQAQAGAGSMMGSGQSQKGQMSGQGMMGQTDGALAEGEIRKVDLEARKLTIRHGAIPNIDMPPMTMVYQVQDPAMLGPLKAGDKIKFAAEKVGGALTVTRIERSQ